MPDGLLVVLAWWLIPTIACTIIILIDRNNNRPSH